MNARNTGMLWIVAAAGLWAAAPRAAAGDELLDHVDDQLSFGAWDDALRVHVSGTLDLEGYALSPAEQGLVFSEGTTVFNPRLSLFLDAQLGRHIYAFAQARADNGFD